MNSIPVFAAEREDKVAPSILKNNSIAYASQIKTIDNDAVRAKVLDLSQFAASSLEDKDLFPLYSILVSTSINKNDDCFDKQEVWAAKESPSHKPCNLDHDEHKLVGHITSAWPVDGEYNILSASSAMEDLPDFYHILIGQALYTKWQDSKLTDRTQALLKSIEDGEKFVSMECYFKNFSYAVVAPDGHQYIIPRTDKTASLTKHLRAYGGSGEYENHKIYRLLRNLTFSAAGIVERPANPDSIIFNGEDAKRFNFSKANIQENLFLASPGVWTYSSNNKENFKGAEVNMSDVTTKHLETQVEELKASLKTLQGEKSSLQEKLSKADVEKWESQVAELSKNLADTEKALVEANTAFQSTKDELAEANKQVKELVDSKAALQTELDESQTSQRKVSRAASLVDGGMEKDKAESAVDKFDNLTDEQFGEVSAALLESVKAAKDKDKKKKDDEEDADAADDGEANADTDLDNAEASNDDKDVALATDDEGDTGEADTRKALASWIASTLNQDDDSGE